MKNFFTFLGIFISSILLLVGANTANAQETTPEPVNIKYDLAFPGLLPDNPFYGLKQIRDRITISLITDPARKIEYYLLQADKGILATAILIDKKGIPLAEKTLLRAENNMTMLSNEFSRMPKKPENSLFTKLKTASLKHQEVISSLIARLPENQRKTFQQVLDFSKSNMRTIEKYSNKNPTRWSLSD